MSTDAIVLLKNDHKDIRKAFNDFEKAGENAHATQQPAQWWDVLLRNCAARHPGVTYRFTIREKAGKRSLLQKLFGSKARDTMLSNAA